MRTRAAAALLALAACGAGASAPDGAGIAAAPASATVLSGPLVFAGGVELRGGGPLFGGFSGLEVSDDGARFVAVSDNAVWLEGRLLREDGRLVGAEPTRLATLRNNKGGRGWHALRDAEGLALDGADFDGARFVSFERWDRISRFDGGDASEAIVARQEAWDALPINNGHEALALSPDGELLAVREEWGDEGEAPAVWIAPGGAMRVAGLPRDGDAVPTGADFGPDGRLYVVERSFRWPFGFRFRLRRFEREGDGFGPGETLLELGELSGADNGEGVSVWRDPNGDIRIDVVTDDNFNMLQRTLILEFVLPAKNAG